MDRAIPEVNRILATRLHEHNRATHRMRLRKISKTINNEPPTSLDHPISKRGKQQKLEGNFAFLPCVQIVASKSNGTTNCSSTR